MLCSSSSSNLAHQQQRSRPRPLVAPAFVPVDQSLATAAFSYTPGLCSSSTISSSRHGDELHGFVDNPPAAKTTTAACVRDTSYVCCCCCEYVRQSSKLHRKRKSSSKEVPSKGRCWNLSLVPLLLLPKSHASALHRCYDARTHARPPHFRRTRERARRRRPDRGKGCSLTKSFQSRRVTLRTDRLPQRSTNLLYPTRGDLLATNLRTYEPTFTFFYTSQFFFFWMHFKFFRGGGPPVPTIKMDRVCIL